MTSSTIMRVLKTSAKLAVTIAVMVFIVWRFGWHTIVETVAQARVEWLWFAAGLFLVSCWLGAIQWQILLKNKGIRLRFRKTFSLYFVGMFFNNFALGAVTGDAVKIAYLKLGKENGKAGFAATFLDRFAGLWAMLGFALAGSAMLIKQKALESRSMDLAILALAVTFILFGGVLAFLVSSRLQRLIHGIIDRIPLWKKDFIRQVIDETILESHDRHLILSVGVLSTVVQFMRIVVHVMCGASLGLVSLANLHYYFIFVPVLAMFMIIPLPFGIRESVGGTLFALAGFKSQAAFVMGFLASLVGIAVSLLGGLLFVAEKAHTSREKQ
jgi:glycosyltransferase 2 family protein